MGAISSCACCSEELGWTFREDTSLPAAEIVKAYATLTDLVYEPTEQSTPRSHRTPETKVEEEELQERPLPMLLNSSMREAPPWAREASRGRFPEEESCSREKSCEHREETKPPPAGSRLRLLVERESLEEELGLGVRSLTSKLFEVVSILPDGAAAQAPEPVQVGDLVHRVNGIGGSCERMAMECVLRANLAFDVVRPRERLEQESLETLMGEQGRPQVPPLRLPLRPV